jgi:hypothetical protein
MAKQLVVDLTALMKDFKSEKIDPDEAWRQLQAISKDLQILCTKTSNEEQKQYLEKADKFRVAIAEQIMMEREKVGKKTGRKNLDLIEKELNELLEHVTTQVTILFNLGVKKSFFFLSSRPRYL